MVGRLWILSLCFVTVISLYEDQIGKFDWKLQLLGRPRYVTTTSDSGVSLLIVASDKNVLASLNPASGAVLWRRVLETGSRGSINCLRTTASGHIVTLIGTSLLRVWDSANGLLVSETLLNSEHCTNSSVGSVYTGWSRDTSRLTAYHVLSRDSQRVTVLTVNITQPHSTSDVISDVTLNADWLDTTDSCIGSSDALLCVSGDRVYSLPLSGLSHSIQLPQHLQRPFSLQLISGQLVVLDSNKHVQLVAVRHGRLVVGATLDRVDAVCEETISAEASLEPATDSSLIRVLFRLNQTRLESRVLSVEKPSDVISSHGVSLAGHVSGALQCYASSAARGGELGLGAAQLLLVGSDHSVTLTDENGDVLWLREEALASVTTTELVDLPIGSDLVSVEEEFDQDGGGLLWSLIHRLASQWNQLLELIISFSSLASIQQETASEKLVRDKFNMDKILVLATDPGKVFGIETSTGRIRWRSQLAEETGPVLLMALQRGSAHSARGALLSLLTARQLVQLEPISGQIVSRQHLQHSVLQASMLQVADEAFVKPLLVLDSNLNVHVYPASAESLVKSISDSLYFHSVDKRTALARGFTVSQDLRAVPIWQHNFSASGSVRIHQAALKSSYERVHSQGVVLTDRSVLYKYINPNLMVIVTESTDLVYKSCVSVFVLDTVTGQVVYSHVQRRSRCPCHVVHSENWFIYSSYNEKARRTELNSIELFESSSQNNATAFSSLDNPPIPLVLKQSFIFPTHIEAMTHTMTEKGITAKYILFGLPSGGVLEMARAMLDPRRAVLGVAGDGGVGSGDTRATAPVYVPELSVSGYAVVSYNNSVAGTRQIVTWPSGLESTSLLLAYGLDLYWSRVFPSRMFDQLKDDFECWLIVVVLSALLFASLLSRRLAQRKSLKQAWT